MAVSRPGKISMGPDSPVSFYIASKRLERCTVSGEREKNVKGKWKMERTHPNGWLVGSDEAVKLCIRLVVWAHRNILYN